LRVSDLRRILSSTFGFALLAAGAGLTLACPGGGPIRFAAVLPLTGSAQVYGTTIRNGIEIAIAEARKSPEFAKMEFTFSDTASDPERGMQVLRQVYRDGALAAIGGVTSAEALAMVKVADDEQRVLLSPSASNPSLTGISTNFYRVFPSDFAEGTVMARYAFDNLRLRNGVVLAKEETYAKGIQKVFADEFQRKGGKIQETVEFPPNTDEFMAFADRVAVLKPDFVYVAAYAEEIAKIITDLKKVGYGGIILTTSSFAAAATIAEVGSAAEGAYFTQSTFQTRGDLSPEVQAFVSAYRARFGSEPDLYAAHGYDALNMLLEAYRKGGTTGLSFWKGMRSIHEYPGVTGTLQFDEKGDVAKFPHVYVVTDGRAVDVEERRQEEIRKAREQIEKIQREMENLRNSGN